MPDYDETTGEIIEAPRTPMMTPQMRPLASAEVNEVCSALAKAQGEFESPKRTKKGKIEGTSRTGREYSFEYTYAPLEEIVRVVQKPMAEAGLSRQQYIVQRSNMWFVRTIVWHVSGQWLSSDYPIFAEAMTGQKFAAAVTYAKRQGLCLVTGIAPEDDNDLQEQAEAPPLAAKPTATRTTPAVRPATPDADLARATVIRIRSDINSAVYVEELNARGIHGPRAADDEKLIRSQAGGAAVWQNLVDRDAAKRLELIAGSADGEAAPGEPVEYRI